MSGATRERAKKILISSYSEVGRVLLEMPLHGSGCHLLTASGGPETIEIAVKERPELILMDVNLPKLDGIGVTRRVREHPEISDTPIIIVSAYDSPALREAAANAGCDYFLIKPVKDEALKRVVCILLEGRRPPATY